MTRGSILTLEKEFDLNPQITGGLLIEADATPQERFAILFSQSTTKISKGYSRRRRQLDGTAIARAAYAQP
jgi:hypothetical protein